MIHENRMSTAEWMPDDPMDHGYDMMIFDGDDERPERKKCKVMRKTAPEYSAKGLLYVPGMMEAGFPKDMAQMFNRHGYDFYTVDVSAMTRKKHPGEARYEQRELEDYFDGLRAALEAMKNDGISGIVVLGHATGALAAILFLQAYAEEGTDVTAAVMNSPFLSYNKIYENDGGEWKRAVAIATKALEQNKVGVPILILTSDNMGSPIKGNNDNVTIFTVYDGEVDVSMEQADVKAVAYTEIFSWLESKKTSH